MIPRWVQGSSWLGLRANNTHTLSTDLPDCEEPIFVKIMFQPLRDVLITSRTKDHSTKQDRPCQKYSLVSKTRDVVTAWSGGRKKVSSAFRHLYVRTCLHELILPEIFFFRSAKRKKDSHLFVLQVYTSTCFLTEKMSWLLH